jgi:hypothetical protein
VGHNRITEDHIRTGTADGEWSSVMGYLDGTFTKPMTLPRWHRDPADWQVIPSSDGEVWALKQKGNNV